VAAGAPVDAAIRMVPINSARHMRPTPWVESIAPGRHGDMVLLTDVADIGIAGVWADGRQVSAGQHYLPAVPRIGWPVRARQTVRIDLPLTAADFAVPAPKGRVRVQAALLPPFHPADDFITADLPVE